MKILLILICFFLSGCSQKFYLENDFTKDKQKLALSDQNISKFPKFQGEILLNKDEFLEKTFSVWDRNFTKISSEEAFWGEEILNLKNLFFNKNEKITQDFLEKIAKNLNKKFYLKSQKTAILKNATLIRNLPTSRAIFLDFSLPGQGEPFDLNANTFLNDGAPLLISHFSKDKKFAFVFSDITSGWVEVKNLKILNKKQRNFYKKSDFLVVLKGDKFRFGAILPFVKSGQNYKIKIFNTLLLKDEAQEFPLKFNDENIKKIISNFQGKPYGWGGFEGFWDCSLLLRDFFAIFGFHLPRNSSLQSKIGTNFDLLKLNSFEKRKFLSSQAKPYQTLLYFNGHIMLFVGEDKIWHSIWGLKTKDNKRAVIGGVAITSLDIGKYKIPNKNLLINKITSANILDFARLKNVKFDKNLSEILSENLHQNDKNFIKNENFTPKVFNVVNQKYKDEITKIPLESDELKDKVKNFIKERSVMIGGEIRLESGEARGDLTIK